jgi:hypothetical protein
MRFLLDSSESSELIAALVIILIGIVVAIITYVLLKKHNFGEKNKKAKGKLEVELNKEYVSEPEMKLLECVHRALPKDFIAFPRVGVDKIVSPTKNLVAYNSIMSKYVDICVFLRKTMEPVLAIDIMWDNTAKQQFAEMDTNVIDVLKAVKLKVVKIKIEPAYDLSALKKTLLLALPDKVIAMLKNDYIENN